MERNGYQLFRQPGEINILYAEGANLDGTPNPDEKKLFSSHPPPSTPISSPPT